MLGFKDPLTLDEGYPSKIWALTVVCDRNSNTCWKNRARTNLLKQEEKLGRFTSSPYVCHTKAMTALVECGIKCLY